MSLEALAALAAAGVAQSPALLGFGGDSAIELFSAIVALWRFRTHRDVVQAEKLAARVAGGFLFLLSAFVLSTSALSLLGYGKPHPSSIGIPVLVLAVAGMPWLASQKRQLASQLSSASLRADSAESALCGYLSLIALAGLLANAFLHIPSADPRCRFGACDSSRRHATQLRLCHLTSFAFTWARPRPPVRVCRFAPGTRA